jgi:hypothetical protein
VPKLVHARKAKLMMGEINKTDRLDVRGLSFAISVTQALRPAKAHEDRTAL